MSNFTFLPAEFPTIKESAFKAEGHIMSDPRAACFHTRFALETIVHWLYRYDTSLRMPYDQNLATLLHAPCFQNLLPEAVFQKARVILKVGNLAVHDSRPVRQYDALQVVKELHHLCYWLVRTYTTNASLVGAAWRDERIPTSTSSDEVVPRIELENLEKRLVEKNIEAFKQRQERDTLDTELQEARQQLAEIRAAAEQKTDTHNYSEDETRHYLIDVDLQRAGWPLTQDCDKEYEVIGMPNQKGIGFADYVLWGDDGKPLAVVEAKKTTTDPTVGQHQAKLYADCLQKMHGQRPVIFYTNGYKTHMWDDLNYPPRKVAGFYKKEELTRLIRRRAQQQPLDIAGIDDEIVERYYQKRAIGSIGEQFTQTRRKALLVMATGTGKTRTAIALVDLLQRAGWVKRVLFLADRISLVNQAANAFKKYLTDSSPVNLVTEKEKEGRVYVSTYQTMMGLIDETKGDEARFGIGHFDLVIIDEAHRSVYQKYSVIFEYFDSLLVGLTATPRDQVDRNTYELFDLEPGVPTDAYELNTGVADKYLVPPKVQQIDLKFPREGIQYDALSDHEKEQWESLDWGDEVDTREIPDRVNAEAINSWLFNKDTVDKVLQYLMENGHKVEDGDRLGKTIIFARNHEHAVFIEERFNHHYPHHKGHFARIIDNYAKYPQNLLDEFSQKDKAPHIAISVDMLDTGIDVPEVVNLVFFKPVYSKIKFWQMIGRGTRLCPDLYGLADNKQDFRIFDFCFNYDFFRENPNGIEGTGGTSLSTRLFRTRVQLLGQIQTFPELDPDGTLKESLSTCLHEEVASMNHDNFIVRRRLQAVERFQNREIWNQLSETDREILQSEVADLPNQIKTDDLESRQFDLTAYRMQLAQANADKGTFESLRQRVVEMAILLEEKASIPAVKAQLEYLSALQETEFWEGIQLKGLEELRLRLRGLTPLLDKKKRNIVYTDFKDEIISVREEAATYMPKMTGAQYEKKVKAFLRNHLDHIVIHRLRSNQPLTKTDLQGLETTLTEIGQEDGQTLLSELLARSDTPSLAHFVRSLVGLDRTAAQSLFAEFLSDRSLTTQQINFIQMVIDQLTSRGVMEASALYDQPFTKLHSGGPETLFGDKKNVIEGIFKKLELVNCELNVEAG